MKTFKESVIAKIGGQPEKLPPELSENIYFDIFSGPLSYEEIKELYHDYDEDMINQALDFLLKNSIEKEDGKYHVRY